MSHNKRRQNRKGHHGHGGQPHAGAPFGSISLAAGQPGQPGHPGNKQPGVSWALPQGQSMSFNPQASISAVPGAYPFWGQPSGQPGQPGQPGGQPGQPGGNGQPGQPGSSGYHPPPRMQKHGKNDSAARGPLPPGKRQRFQSESRQPGQPGTPNSGVAPHPAVLGLQGFGGNANSDAPHPLAGPQALHPGTPSVIAPTPIAPITPLLPFTAARPPWVLDSPARAHFPHSSLSFPLPSPGPRSTHFNKDSISYPSSKPVGPAPPGRRVPSGLQAAHGRVGSINQRVGPPPKAILGGPGGKTFDELKVTPTPTRSTSLEVTPDVSRRSSFGASSVASTEGSPQKAPSTVSANESFEIKHMGNTVRIALPPGKYSPPDTPVEMTAEPEEGASDDSREREPLPPRIPRKEAFPWPAPQVRISPTGIPLPLSPTEGDLDAVEAALSLGEESPAKAGPSDGDAEGPSLVPSWIGKEVVVSVPARSGWQKLRPMRAGFVEPVDKLIDEQNQYERMDLDMDMDLDSNESGRTSPMGSTTWATAVDESVPGMSPPAFTALQEPWPPTRSGTPSEDDKPAISPIEEDLEREYGDHSDTDTATPPPRGTEDPSTAASVPLPTNPPNTAASPDVDAAPIPPHSAGSPPASPPNPPAVPPNTAVNGDDPPLTAIPLDGSARFPGIDTSSPAPSPIRRTFGINPFLKRSLGGMLRDTPRTRSTTSSPAPSRLSSPVTRAATLPEDGKKEDDKPEVPAQSEILPGEEADEEDNAAEPAPVAEVKPTEEIGDSADTVTTPTTAAIDAVRTDTDPSSPLSPPGSASTTRSRPTGVFVNAAFRRQVQAFIPSNASAFKPEPSPLVSEFPKRDRSDDEDDASNASDAESPATQRKAELDAAPEAETKEVASPAPIPATAASSHEPSLAFDGMASSAVNTISTFSPKPTTTSVPDTMERPRSPPRDPTATKRLKPTAAPFMPKPTAAPFVPKPTAPAFKPTAPVFKPSAPVFVPNAPVFVPGAPSFVPTAPAFVPRPQGMMFNPNAQPLPLAGLPMAFAPVSFEPKSTKLAPRSLAALLTKSPSGLRPTALPFVPGGPVTFGAPQADAKADDDGGSNSLGLFTFTASPRPNAPEALPESKADHKPNPRTGPNGTPYRPPPLDLSRSEPASRAFALLETPFNQAETAAQESHTHLDTASSDMARRHSFKESSDIKRKQAFHDSGSVDLGRRHSFKASVDLQPWRNEASPRSDTARSVHSPVEAGVAEDAPPAPRDSPRRRTHTAKRSSQNSYLSRNMISKSTPSSPVKTLVNVKDSPSSVLIVRSRPIRDRASSGSRSWISPQSDNLDTLSERMEHLPMPCSADEFSPIAPVPSDIDAMSDATGPSDALRESVLERELSMSRDMSREESTEPREATHEEQISAGLSTFGGNAGSGDRDSFTVTTKNPAPYVFGAAASPSRPQPPTELRPTTPTPPAIQVELTDENKFRKWIFPTGSAATTPEDGPSRPSSRHDEHHHSDVPPSPPIEPQGLSAAEELDGEASASEVNEEEVEWRTWRRGDESALSPESPHLHSSNTSAEFPMRTEPPRVLTVVNGHGAGTTPHRSLLPLSPEPQPSIAGRDESHEILDVLQRIQQQIALLSLDNETKTKDAERRADEAYTQTSVATEALDLIKEYIPNRGALESIAKVLELQGDLLQDIQHKLDEEEDSDHDRTLVAPEVPTNAMIKAVLSSQNTMMDKFADFAEAQEAIYELRSATDALLEAHTDVRELKADRAQAVLQTQALNDLQKQLREETNKSRKAEKEIAALKAKLEESAKRAKEREMDDMWRSVIKSDMAAATASLAKVSQSEEHARQELNAMRELMAKQAAEQTATIDQLRAEREAMAMLAEERHAEMARMQAESSAFKQRILDRFDMFETTVQASDKDRVAALEKEVAGLRSELSESTTANADLRVQLTQALADVQLEREKSIRSGDEETAKSRNIDLQLKGEKARSSYLESKVQKLESEVNEVNQNLDVWRSAALEQRLRAEQSAVQIAALQQENYHWREFALGADRHRLEQWLATKPFHEGAAGAATPTPVASPSPRHRSTPSPTRTHPGAHYPQAGSPLKHAMTVPAIVVPE